MSNLLIKILFISLLSSAAMPFSVQAGVIEGIRLVKVAAVERTGMLAEGVVRKVTTLAEWAKTGAAQWEKKQEQWAKERAKRERRWRQIESAIVVAEVERAVAAEQKIRKIAAAAAAKVREVAKKIRKGKAAANKRLQELRKRMDFALKSKKGDPQKTI